jgi:hypothetical protein
VATRIGRDTVNKTNMSCSTARGCFTRREENEREKGGEIKIKNTNKKKNARLVGTPQVGTDFDFDRR